MKIGYKVINQDILDLLMHDYEDFFNTPEHAEGIIDLLCEYDNFLDVALKYQEGGKVKEMFCDKYKISRSFFLFSMGFIYREKSLADKLGIKS